MRFQERNQGNQISREEEEFSKRVSSSNHHLWYSAQSSLPLPSSLFTDGKFPRPFELNTDIVTWARLVTRTERVVGDTNSSPLVREQDRSKSKTSISAGPDSSPPLSPLTASGENTPKSPLTPPPQGVATGMAQGQDEEHCI